MTLTSFQENRMLELEKTQNLNSMEEIELQNLLDYYYDTGDCEKNKSISDN